MIFFLFINVKMPTVVGILIFMSRKNLMLNSVEHEKSFLTLGPDIQIKGHNSDRKSPIVTQIKYDQCQEVITMS